MPLPFTVLGVGVWVVVEHELGSRTLEPVCAPKPAVFFVDQKHGKWSVDGRAKVLWRRDMQGVLD